MMQIKDVESLNYSDFEHVKKLQEGGFGTVHEFQSSRRTFFANGSEQTQVAMKFFGYVKDGATGMADRPDVVFIKREIEFMRDLRDVKNVARLYGVATDSADGFLTKIKQDFQKNPRHRELYPVIVMEKINGGDLIDNIERKKNISEKDLSTMFKGIVDALFCIHKKSFLHCDLKLENIMLHTYDNSKTHTVKIVDFGSMQRMSLFDKFISTKLLGTLGYIAPESISIPHTYSPKSEVWQLGLTLYQMVLCDAIPFKFTSLLDGVQDKLSQLMVLSDSAYDALLFPKDKGLWHDNTLSYDVKDLLRNCLRRNEKDRFSIAQILNHPWLKQASSERLGDAYQSKIRNLTIRKELKDIFKKKPESDEAARKLFLSIDTDHNGVIDLAELIAGMKAWIPHCSEEDARQTFYAIDVDDDKSITESEFKKFYFQIIQNSTVKTMRTSEYPKVPPFKSRYSEKNDRVGELFRCVPKDIIGVPKIMRTIVGYVTLFLFAACFWALPSCFLLPFFWFYLKWYNFVYGYSAMILMSYLIPNREWHVFRRLGQFWFEIFQFSTNISPKSIPLRLNEGDLHKFIIGMHPHGVVPYQALLWSAYCDLYLSNIRQGDTQALYGFGATADVCTYLPFLRNIMAWNSAASCKYSVLRDGLKDGNSLVCGDRRPRHLYILPGGIAELFLSKPGSHEIRELNTGLIKLALETGARLIPCYVFGGTDFFHNLVTGDWFLPKLFRKMRMAPTLYWGRCFTFFPYTPKVTLCVGDPLIIEKYSGDIKNIPNEAIQAVRDKYQNSMLSLFETYKAPSGYPNAKLIFNSNDKSL